VGTGFRRVGTFSSEQTVVGLSETVFDGGRTRTAIRQASASARVSDANLELARQERVLVVTQAYFNALLTKRLADIADQAVEESARQRELIQARIDAGDAARVDIYPVEVQLANARLNKLQADNDVRVAANALRNAVGLDRGPELRPADVEEPSFRIPSLEESLSAALNDRPEVARHAAELDSAGAALSLAKSQIVPVPTASLNYDRGLAGTGYDSQWSVGFGLSMNLFDAGAARAEVDGSRARVDSLTLREDQLRKDVSAEVEEAHLNLTNALERLAASKANVNLAQTNLEVARVKYEQGLAIPLEIVSAQVSYSDAQTSHAQTLYDCYIARARLDKVIGRRTYRS
jgi:outer membrane protein TolC